MWALHLLKEFLAQWKPVPLTCWKTFQGVKYKDSRFCPWQSFLLLDCKQPSESHQIVCSSISSLRLPSGISPWVCITSPCPRVWKTCNARRWHWPSDPLSRMPPLSTYMKKGHQADKGKVPDGTSFQMSAFGQGNNKEYLVHNIAVNGSRSIKGLSKKLGRCLKPSQKSGTSW